MAAIIALTHTAVRRGGLAPFGWWPRFVRRLTGPLLHGVERRVAAAGQNPQDASLWLLGAVSVIGLLAITLTRWVFGTILALEDVKSSGPAVWASLVISGATWILMTAILVRVIGLWMGFGRYHRVMRHLYTMTDWLIEPIRRRLPSVGMLDLSPFVAYMVLWAVREVLLALLR